MTIAGTLIPMTGFTVPSTGTGLATIAMYSPDAKDVFVITVWPDGTQPWPGPTPPAFTTNQMLVAIHKQVPAQKEMLVWDINDQAKSADILTLSLAPIRWHILTPGDTLQFKKFDGNSNVLATYRLDNNEFWSAFKGKLVLFNWVRDS